MKNIETRIWKACTHLPIAIWLAVLVFSCGQPTIKNELGPVNSSTATVGDSVKVSESVVEQSGDAVSPYQAELDKALNDPTIGDYYKDIYKQEKLISASDSSMLSITDSLFTANPDKDLFYFIVFTKSMNGSDGFYSESVGLSALAFVTKKTEQFADYFNIAPKLTDRDLDRWANAVVSEIRISEEGQELKAVNKLEALLLKNIDRKRKEYKVVIERFIKKIYRGFGK
jgi:hypothetical protein